MAVSGVCPGRIICRYSPVAVPGPAGKTAGGCGAVHQMYRCDGGRNSLGLGAATVRPCCGTVWWTRRTPMTRRPVTALCGSRTVWFVPSPVATGPWRCWRTAPCGVPQRRFLPEWETSPDRSPAAPEKLLDQVRMPSPSPAWAADAPPPAVLKSASLEAWEARQADAADAEMGPDSLPVQEESPAERTGGQEILELGVLAASLPGLLLAAWIRGRKK